MSEGGDGPFCRVCNKEFRTKRGWRYVCCNGHDCGCYGAVLPNDVCSASCLENEEQECETCGGRGEVGGFLSIHEGYQTDPCPDCGVPNVLTPP